MTQVALGLAREGYNVFTYSIGNFPTLRCIEHVRSGVCYHDANVKIVAVGAGYAYGPQGVSHHATEDLAMLRAIPNMLVGSPADPVEAEAITRFMATHRGPGYVRLNKSGEKPIHDRAEPVDVVPGRLLEVRRGRDAAVLCTGAILERALREVEEAAAGWAVFSAPFVGGYADEQMLAIARRFESIVTLEEHQMNGGLGSSVVECLSDLYADGRLDQMPRVRRIGIPNLFLGVSGSQDYLRDRASLTLRGLFGDLGVAKGRSGDGYFQEYP
jgi:transketolase